MRLKPKVNDMSTAIVLFSGGLDSTACLYWAKEKYNDIILLSFIYGSKEDEAIQKTNMKYASLLSTDAKIISLPFLKDFSERAGSSLVISQEKLPVFDSYEQLDKIEITQETAKSVWVPGRNILFLSLASSFADSFKEPVDIIFGANIEEGETFPDNTLEFVNRMNESIALGCLNKVEIKAPFHDCNKISIIKFLTEQEAIIDFSSSCYKVQKWTESDRPIHCGICESCLRRKRAFQLAKITDSTLYE